MCARHQLLQCSDSIRGRWMGRQKFELLCRRIVKLAHSLPQAYGLLWIETCLRHELKTQGICLVFCRTRVWE